MAVFILRGQFDARFGLAQGWYRFLMRYEDDGGNRFLQLNIRSNRAPGSLDQRGLFFHATDRHSRTTLHQRPPQQTKRRDPKDYRLRLLNRIATLRTPRTPRFFLPCRARLVRTRRDRGLALNVSASRAGTLASTETST